MSHSSSSSLFPLSRAPSALTDHIPDSALSVPFDHSRGSRDGFTASPLWEQRNSIPWISRIYTCAQYGYKEHAKRADLTWDPDHKVWWTHCGHPDLLNQLQQFGLRACPGRTLAEQMAAERHYLPRLLAIRADPADMRLSIAILRGNPFRIFVSRPVETKPYCDYVRMVCAAIVRPLPDPPSSDEEEETSVGTTIRPDHRIFLTDYPGESVFPLQRPGIAPLSPNGTSNDTDSSPAPRDTSTVPTARFATLSTSSHVLSTPSAAI
jgi:hypothetical protein